jgi:hypothetical protein
VYRCYLLEASLEAAIVIAAEDLEAPKKYE